MKKFDIIIFGCGNVGSRHLQGVLKSKLKSNIYVIENNQESILVAKQRIKEIKNLNNKKVFFYKDLNFKKIFFDLAIVATNSHNRVKFVENIIKQKMITNMIIEKVAFQNLKDYETTLKLIKKNQISCWINCARNSHGIYNRIKNKIDTTKKIEMEIKGNGWNLASNTIHFIDLFFYLSNREGVEFFNKIYKKNKIVKSKRNLYHEIKGVIKLFNNLGDKIVLEDDNKNNKDLIIKIRNSKNLFEINESKNTFQLTQTINKKKSVDRIKFKTLLQSNLSSLYVTRLSDKKALKLPTINNSYFSHKILLDVLKKQFEYSFKKKITKCLVS
jgi:hypothetical protein